MTREPTNETRECPFCELLAGRATELNRETDLVFRDERVAAFVSPKWWASSPGHVLVVPTTHYENLYETPDEILGHVYAMAKRIARAFKQAYACDGTSTRQHNERGGGQDVFHLHVHVFPRYEHDRLYERNDDVRWPSPEEREHYAERLRAALDPG